MLREIASTESVYRARHAIQRRAAVRRTSLCILATVVLSLGLWAGIWAIARAIARLV